MPLPDDLFKQFYEMQIKEHPITWDRLSTGKKLKELREHNVNIARYTCKYSRLYKIHNLPIPSADVPCRRDPPYHCSDCYDFHKKDDGTNDVSRRIMSHEKGLSSWNKDQISALENGKDLTLEKVMFYAFLAQIPLSDILVLGEGYVFDKDGIIRKKT